MAVKAQMINAGGKKKKRAKRRAAKAKARRPNPLYAELLGANPAGRSHMAGKKKGKKKKKGHNPFALMHKGKGGGHRRRRGHNPLSDFMPIAAKDLGGELVGAALAGFVVQEGSDLILKDGNSG